MAVYSPWGKQLTGGVNVADPNKLAAIQNKVVDKSVTNTGGVVTVAKNTAPVVTNNTAKTTTQIPFAQRQIDYNTRMAANLQSGDPAKIAAGIKFGQQQGYDTSKYSTTTSQTPTKTYEQIQAEAGHTILDNGEEYYTKLDAQTNEYIKNATSRFQQQAKDIYDPTILEIQNQVKRILADASAEKAAMNLQYNSNISGIEGQSYEDKKQNAYYLASKGVEDSGVAAGANIMYDVAKQKQLMENNVKRAATLAALQKQYTDIQNQMQMQVVGAQQAKAQFLAGNYNALEEYSQAMQQKMAEARREDSQIIQQRDWNLMDTAKAKDYEVASNNTAYERELKKMAIQQQYTLQQISTSKTRGNVGSSSEKNTANDDAVYAAIMQDITQNGTLRNAQADLDRKYISTGKYNPAVIAQVQSDIEGLYSRNPVSLNYTGNRYNPDGTIKSTAPPKLSFWENLGGSSITAPSRKYK